MYFISAIGVIIIASIWLLYYLSVYHVPEPQIKNTMDEIKAIRKHQLIKAQSEELQVLRGDTIPLTQEQLIKQTTELDELRKMHKK